jgi:hypothetical protein
VTARGHRRSVRAAAAMMVTVATLGACNASVPGRAMRATKPAPASISARDLLLQDGDSTPLGAASGTKVGPNYFTSARPPECSAALLFEDSPLRPAGSSDHAESSYRFTSSALYAESVDVYANTLNTGDVVRNGFRAVSDCHSDVIGATSMGEYPPMRLSFFATPADGVLVWTMTRPDWTCDYGLAVIPRVALLISACDVKTGFPMADWTSKRKSQLDRGAT